MSPAERAFCPRHIPQKGRSANLSAEEMSGIMSTSDTKARNGPTPTKENRMIPRFIWTAKEHWRSFVTVLDILARDRLRWRCQCALPSSTRSTPAMMSAMPTTMVRVSGSPKRNLEAIAVTATPPADQIP